MMLRRIRHLAAPRGQDLSDANLKVASCIYRCRMVQSADRTGLIASPEFSDRQQTKG